MIVYGWDFGGDKKVVSDAKEDEVIWLLRKN